MFLVMVSIRGLVQLGLEVSMGSQATFICVPSIPVNDGEVVVEELFELQGLAFWLRPSVVSAIPAGR